MKRKISILAIFLGFCMTAFAKQYVTISNFSGSGSYYYVEGALPSGVFRSYDSARYSFADILNILASKGFEVEFFDRYNTGMVIMSKSGTPESNAIEEISSDDDAEATEVARYNMQGLPVNENEKGVQIVVYSNFTAKVVIVQ